MSNIMFEKIESRKAKVGVIGLGYVGLPLCVEVAKSSFKCVGFDIESSKIKSIQEGSSYVESVDGEELKNLLLDGHLDVDYQISILRTCDIFIVCVPTPLDDYLNPDTRFVWGAVESICSASTQSEILVVVESTTYPGHTVEIGDYIRSQLTGTRVLVGFSPEREDPGNANFNTRNIPKVVSGDTDESGDLVEAFYSSVVDSIVRVKDTKTAEFTKLFENTFRSVNIGFVNEMKIVADRIGLDIFEIIEAASTKPFGFMPFFPGPGLGGHCIPIDPFYLSHVAKKLGINPKFIEISGEINRAMPNFVVDKITMALNSVHKSINGSEIAIWGVAYKPDISDKRESPSLEIAQKLIELGAQVTFIDPHIEDERILDSSVLETSNGCIDKHFDNSVVSTFHREFSTEEIMRVSKTVVDTRGCFPSRNSAVWRA